MKKATDSKNRGRISKLLPIMQEHFGNSMNLARIQLMVLLAVTRIAVVWAYLGATTGTNTSSRYAS